MALTFHPYHSFANGPVKIVALMWARVQISTVKTQIENKSLEQRLVIFEVFVLWRAVREEILNVI